MKLEEGDRSTKVANDFLRQRNVKLTHSYIITVTYMESDKYKKTYVASKQIRMSNSSE